MGIYKTFFLALMVLILIIVPYQNQINYNSDYKVLDNNVIDRYVGSVKSPRKSNGNAPTLEVKWVSSPSSNAIIDVFAGNFSVLDNSHEIAALFDNGSLLFYNWSAGSIISSRTVNYIYDTFVSNSYFVFEYNASLGTLWVHNASVVISFTTAKNGNVTVDDFDGNGISDVIVWNATIMYIYFTMYPNINVKSITPYDFTLDLTSFFIGKIEGLEISDDLSGKEIVATMNGSSEIYVSICKADANWVNYTTWSTSLSSTPITMIVAELDSYDSYIDLLVFSSTSLRFYALDQGALLYINNTDNLIQREFTSISYIVDEYFRIRLFNRDDGCGGVLVKESQTTYYHFYYTVALYEFTFQIDSLYQIYKGHFEGAMDDLLLFARGSGDFEILPGENLVNYDSSTTTFSSLTELYSVEIYDMDHDRFDDLIFGENEYIVFHKAPQFGVSYFDGKPIGPVNILKRVYINTDTVYDYLTVYSDPAGTSYYIYAFISDGEPPTINKVTLQPSQPTSQDSITIYANITDNLYVSYATATYKVKVFDKVFYELRDITLVKSPENLYVATFPPPQISDILYDFTVEIEVKAVDIFGNNESTVVTRDVLSYPDSTSRHDLASDLDGIDEFYFLVRNDTDSDGKLEFYAFYSTVSTDVYGNNHFLYFGDYGNPSQSFYNLSVSTDTLSNPLGLFLYRNGTYNTLLLLAFSNGLQVYKLNLSLITQYNFLTGTGTSVRVLDYDQDRKDEIFYAFDNKTLVIYNITGTQLKIERKITTTMIISDFVYMANDNILYSCYYNGSHTFLFWINMTNGINTNITYFDTDPAYTENRKILSPYANKAVLALENGTLVLFDTNSVSRVSVLNPLSNVSAYESYTVNEDFIVVVDTAGYVYLINSTLEISRVLKVPFGAKPISLEYEDLDRDGEKEIAVSYFENYLNIIDLNDRRNISLSIFSKSEIFVGDFDAFEGNDILFISETDLMLVHDVSKYYTVILEVPKFRTEIYQGDHIIAKVSLENLFYDAISDASVKALIETQSGAVLTNPLINFGNGTYYLDVSTDGWDFGYVNITILIEHDYYIGANFSFITLIRPILKIVSEDYFHVTHGEKLVVKFDIRDIFDNKVSGAEGKFVIAGYEASIFYNSTASLYQAVINATDLLNLVMGKYTATINITHPLANGYVTRNVTVFIYSNLTVIASVSPTEIDQGNKFNVTVSVRDAGGNEIYDADVKISVQQEEFFGYNASIPTDGWKRGNYTISIYVNHPFAVQPVVVEKYVLVYAIPKVRFYYNYVDAGTDEVVIEVRDSFGNLLTDVAVNLTIEDAVNLTLPGEGIYRRTINFTEYLQQRIFNVTIYVYNGTLVRETITGPYVVDIKLNGKIVLSVTSENGSEYPLQGDNLNVTIYLYDQFGNPLTNITSINLFIEDTPYLVNKISDGIYGASISTWSWKYGIYEIDVVAFSNVLINGELRISDNLLLLPIINVFSYETNYANATTLLKLDFKDNYGYTIDETNFTALSVEPLDIIYLRHKIGGGSILLNGSHVVPGKYNITIKIIWNYDPYNVTAEKTKIIEVSIFSDLKVIVTVHPSNATVVQGDVFRLNITVMTIGGVNISDAYVTVSIGHLLIDAIYVDKYYVANMSTSGFSYGNYSVTIHVYYPYMSNDPVTTLNVKVLGRPKITYSEESFGNKTVKLTFNVRDLYGYSFTKGTIIIAFGDRIFETEITNGTAVLFLNLNEYEVGEYKTTVRISGDYIVETEVPIHIDVVGQITEDTVEISALGIVNDTSEYPNNAVVQGEDLYVNVTVYDICNIPVRNARVAVIFAGTQYYPFLIDNNTYMFRIATENMISGHYVLIIQISGRYVTSEEGKVFSTTKLIYLKPEIHYEIITPQTVTEGENVTIIIRVVDKYGNPLEPIGNRTRITVIVNGKEYEAKYDPEYHAYVVSIEAPSVDREHVYEPCQIEVRINYTGTASIKEDLQITVMATSPVTEGQIISLSSYVFLTTIVLTIIILGVYLIIRLNTFNIKIVKFMYWLLIFLQLVAIIATATLLLASNYDLAAFILLVLFLTIFGLFGLQLRLDQIEIIRAGYKLMVEGKEEVSIGFNLSKYVVIYLSGAVIIFVLFECLGSNILWFSRYILGEYKTIYPIHDITLVTIGFYLFAARGMILNVRKHFRDLIKNKLPAITYAESVEARLNLFTNLVEESLKIMGSSVLNTTIYTLYLLGTYIWGASRLALLRINPAILLILLAPVTIPIALIWVLHFIKLPWEKKMEKIVIK